MKRSSDCLSAGQLLPPSSSSSFDSYSNNVQSIHESLNSNPNAPNFYTDMNSGGNNNDEVDGVKKVKLEEGDGNNNGHDGQSSNRQPNGPSRVVHVRNIPNEANENDLINLGLPFGKISNILLLKGKNQAFIEFGDIASAQCMVSYWQLNSMNAQPTVRGRNVFCQFSNHQQLKQQPNGSDSQNGGQYGNGSSYGGNRGGSSDQSAIESTVLRVVVEHLLYPVTLDTFYQLFSRFGKVTKIVTFTKNQSLQALVQYDSIYSASSAKQSLDAQAMFGGSSNILRVDFSKLTNLNVKYNNDKSRDYTNPGLPSSPGGGAGPGGMGGQVGGYGSPAGYGPGSPQGGSGGGYGMGGSGGSRGSGHGMARDVQMAAAHHAMMGISPVILVSNLPEEIQSPDALFTLFGVYGDVMRVKVLFNKKDNALIQMAEAHQASLALNYLDKLKLFGKMIRVTSSKHSVVQLPKEGQPDSGLTKDFSGSSNLHRFKKPGSKNYSNIYPPSTTLHLSNIPATISEEEIKQMFLDEMNGALSGNTGSGEDGGQDGDGATGGQGPEHPVEITGFKFFPKDRKMALIGFPSVELAVLALIKMHNYQMAESSHLRVSFSKSSI